MKQWNGNRREFCWRFWAVMSMQCVNDSLQITLITEMFSKVFLMVLPVDFLLLKRSETCRFPECPTHGSAHIHHCEESNSPTFTAAKKATTYESQGFESREEYCTVRVCTRGILYCTTVQESRKAYPRRTSKPLAPSASTLRRRTPVGVGFAYSLTPDTRCLPQWRHFGRERVLRALPPSQLSGAASSRAPRAAIECNNWYNPLAAARNYFEGGQLVVLDWDRRLYFEVATDEELFLPVVAPLQRDNRSTDCFRKRHPGVGPLFRVVHCNETANAMQKTTR